MLVAAGGGMEIVSPRHPFGIDGADAQAVGRALVGVVSARRVAGGQEGGDEQGGGQGGEGGHWVPGGLMGVLGGAGLFGGEGRLDCFARARNDGVCGGTIPGGLHPRKRMKVFWFFFSKKNCFLTWPSCLEGGYDCAGLSGSR